MANLGVDTLACFQHRQGPNDSHDLASEGNTHDRGKWRRCSGCGQNLSVPNVHLDGVMEVMLWPAAVHSLLDSWISSELFIAGITNRFSDDLFLLAWICSRVFVARIVVHLFVIIRSGYGVKQVEQC